MGKLAFKMDHREWCVIVEMNWFGARSPEVNDIRNANFTAIQTTYHDKARDAREYLAWTPDQLCQ